MDKALESIDTEVLKAERNVDRSDISDDAGRELSDCLRYLRCITTLPDEPEIVKEIIDAVKLIQAEGLTSSPVFQAALQSQRTVLEATLGSGPIETDGDVESVHKIINLFDRTICAKLDRKLGSIIWSDLYTLRRHLPGLSKEVLQEVKAIFRLLLDHDTKSGYNENERNALRLGVRGCTKAIMATKKRQIQEHVYTIALNAWFDGRQGASPLYTIRESTTHRANVEFLCYRERSKGNRIIARTTQEVLVGQELLVHHTQDSREESERAAHQVPKDTSVTPNEDEANAEDESESEDESDYEETAEDESEDKIEDESEDEIEDESEDEIEDESNIEANAEGRGGYEFFLTGSPYYARPKVHDIMIASPGPHPMNKIVAQYVAKYGKGRGPVKRHDEDNCKEELWEPEEKLKEILSERINSFGVIVSDKLRLWNHEMTLPDTTKALIKKYPDAGINETKLLDKLNYLRGKDNNPKFYQECFQDIEQPARIHHRIVQACNSGHATFSTIQKLFKGLLPRNFDLKGFVKESKCFVLYQVNARKRQYAYEHNDDVCKYKGQEVSL
ncbi:hypothetical protein P154DRAFT_558224 [Amniculicola lignicola CBS 123094]|uniref:SET domain-containing protein n=1 Tax=Amniculicola lignicola CBS 123094 TaxID=1392246 RepID=A0A6A5X4S2_9PLEO|nr:hypothetical protein P154DRAFT_558224 [Amniculicola lignicola CBS 123094]